MQTTTQTTISNDTVRYILERYTRSQLVREVERSKLSLEHFRNDTKLLEALKYKIELYEVALQYAKEHTPRYTLSAEALKSKIDIVEYIGQYTRLWRCGTNKYTGLCPIHGEKHASLFVYSERQDWFCYGCCKGGDIFSFVQAYNDCTFYESLKILTEEL